MRILEYTGLDTRGATAAYRRRVTEAIACGHFRAAQIKKLVGLQHGRYWRAKLDDAGRLLFTLLRHEGETCALMLEVIRNHDDEASRLLRGAQIEEDKIPACVDLPASDEVQPVRYLRPGRAIVHLLDKPLSFDDAQEAIYRQSPPLIVVGCAGSGRRPFFPTASSSKRFISTPKQEALRRGSKPRARSIGAQMARNADIPYAHSK